MYDKPRHRLKQTLFRHRKQFFREFWAVRDIDFEVDRGHTIGVIGRNGSGKSTLLQMIAGTLQPTTGNVDINGRVTALLELGAGFNPEFTGRENVYLNASVMGLEEAEIDARYDDIVGFADIGAFINQPVKHYSSGMFVRLAFAVSAHLDPDVFIVDEALAVGDVRFQRRCFRAFEEMRNRGVTILFVTHATELVVNYCDQALFLHDGRLRRIGSPRPVVNDYLNAMFEAERQARSAARPAGDPPPVSKVGDFEVRLGGSADHDACLERLSYNDSEQRWGDGRAQIVDFLLRCGKEDDPANCGCHEKVELFARVLFSADVGNIVYGMTVKTVEGTTVYATNTLLRQQAVGARSAGDVAILHFSFTTHLMPGDYFISVGVATEDDEHGPQALDRRYDLVHLKIVDSKFGYGIAELDAEFTEYQG